MSEWPPFDDGENDDEAHWDPPIPEWWTQPPGYEPPGRRRVRRGLRAATTSLVALALLVAGIAAGVSLAATKFERGGPAQFTNGPAPARDHGIVDVDTILGYQEA